MSAFGTSAGVSLRLHRLAGTQRVAGGDLVGVDEAAL